MPNILYIISSIGRNEIVENYNFSLSSSIGQKIEPCLSNSINNVPICTVEMDCFIVFLIMSWYDLFERIEYWVLFGSNYDVSGMFAAVSKRVV